MLLNRIEKAFITSRPWAEAQRRYAAPLLRRLGADLDGKQVLEVGCGPGVGTDLLLTTFGAQRVQAIDLDPDMVLRARRRLARFSAPRVNVAQGDALALPAADGSVDAVAEFAIFHHVPDWRAAVAEVVRVLRPGGLFVYAEVTKHALDRLSYRLLFDHPRRDRFTAAQFTDHLAGSGLTPVSPPAVRFFGDFVFGVARAPDSA